MSDRLRAARQRGFDLKIEDFVGMHLLEGVYKDVPLEDENYRGDPCTTPGIVVTLDGVQYGFWPYRATAREDGIRQIRVVDIAWIPCNASLVVEIRNLLDVTDSMWAGNPYELAAELLYATSDQCDGRVVLELGSVIEYNVSRALAAPHRAKLVSNWYPEGRADTPSYLEGRDPDEPMPVEIDRPAKAYHPKFSNKHSGRFARGSAKQRRG